MMAVTAVETAVMLAIPVAKFSVVRRRCWERDNTRAEPTPLLQQAIPAARDKVRIAEWYLREVATCLCIPKLRRETIADLEWLVAHEHYHLKQSRIIPNRYKRRELELEDYSYKHDLLEKAANLFADYYVCLKREWS